jgi:FkbM family methyltransferase
VVAVEPVPANVECLKRNFAKEIRQGRVVGFAKGLWKSDGVLPMKIDAENIAAHSFFSGRAGGIPGGEIELELTTIDRMVEALGLERVDFIKFDIEGAERRALAGGEGILRRWKPRPAVSVYHVADDPTVIPAVIREARADYAYKCGPYEWFVHRIAPQVYFFR